MSPSEKVPYIFQEYPKWVTPPDGSAPVLCETAEREEEVLKTKPKKAAAPVEVAVNRLVSSSDTTQPAEPAAAQPADQGEEPEPAKSKTRSTRRRSNR